MLAKMSAIVGVVVDNFALSLTSVVVLLVSIFVTVFLWVRKSPTNAVETIADNLLADDILPRAKKTVKSKPKKTKSEKVLYRTRS